MSQNINCEIVISGISGRFPNADNMHELAYNLYNKVDMIDDLETRWKHFNDTVARRSGKIRNIDKFDPNCFSFSERHSNYCDPQNRMLTEHCFEAAMDAGISIHSLDGSRTGMFVGCSSLDSKESLIYQRQFTNGNMVSNSQYLLANGVSYAFGLTGPSFTIDTACSSSGYALDAAFKYIQSGACDAAFVCGTQLDLNLDISLGYVSAMENALDINGISRPFDADADGFVRAEAVCAVYIQKAKNAKRVYANLVYTKTNNDGRKTEGMSFPSKFGQKRLFGEFYDEIKIDPSKVSFVEAHATGTVAGDPQEAWAIDEVFCKNRQKPLPIGSIKSNMGHAEAAAAMTSLAKIILTLESKKIPPNINFVKPRPEIEALIDGRLRVVTETEDLDGSLIAMNSYGIIGANSHALLRGNMKEKINKGIPNDNLDRLLLWAGRTLEAVDHVFNDITKRALDAEYIALLQSTQTKTMKPQIHRGFGIFKHDFDSGRAVCVKKEIHQSNTVKCPIVWVYSGVGSQWLGMGKALMKIPIFADAIEKCHETLSTVNVDLKKILSSDDDQIFDNIVNTFVGIAAVQIGLTDILKALNLSPDFIIGHSVGELGCAYADESLTAEQMILSTHARGMACKETPIVKGRMAAIGMELEELKQILPDDIDIACHNTSNLYTISGPSERIKNFVEEASSKRIFARNVDSVVPFHSRYIADAGPVLYEKLSKIISDPKPRSEKWLSTSVPIDEWNLEDNKKSSASYHTNNLLNPVLFAETCEKLPPNALTIEVAPHGLLQAVLKRSMKEGVHVSLTNKSHEDGALFLMEALGRIFQNGHDLDVSKLYPAIDFPVSRGTPMISPIIKWDHSDNFFVPFYDPLTTNDKRNIVINLNDEKYDFLRGHVIDGKNLFPGTGYVFLVWETFAMMNGLQYTKARVQIDDLKFLRATILNESSKLIFTVAITRGTNRFEITEGSVAVATGFIKMLNTSAMITNLSDSKTENCVMLQKDDFYKVASLKGYKYSGLFKAIKEVKSDGSFAKIEWHNNWITFLDTIMQVDIVRDPNGGLFLPRSIRKILIDPEVQQKLVDDLTASNKECLIEARICHNMKSVQAGGVEMIDVVSNTTNRRKLNIHLVLANYKFVPHIPKTPTLTQDEMIQFCFQFITENSTFLNIKLVEIDAEDRRDPILSNIQKLSLDLPLVTVELHYLTSKTLEIEHVEVHNDASISSFADANVFIHQKADEAFFDTVQSNFKATTYIICQQYHKDLPSCFYLIANVLTDNDEEVSFLRFIPNGKHDPPKNDPILIEITSNCDDFRWLPVLQEANEKERKVIIYSRSSSSGILGLFRCLRKEPNSANITCFMIDDETAPTFDLNLPFYKNQLQLGWLLNVYKDGSWGTYRHMTLESATETSFGNSHCYVDSLSRGDFSKLTWIKQLNVELNDSSDIVDVHYAALNFCDVMIASGRIEPFGLKDTLKQQAALGLEFSGIIRKTGRRVTGITNNTGGITTQFSTDDAVLFDVPEGWTLEEAATVPLVYTTVYLAFFVEADIRKMKSILIHAGSGGVGLAAIQVAIAYGLNVYTTVSTDEKRNYLLGVFPTLNPEQIGNSRDTSFENMIMQSTQGKGVDVVLNSLSQEKLQASLRCVGKNGIFIEIGKYDMLTGTNISMEHFQRGISFKPLVGLTKGILDEPHFKILFQNDVSNGVIKPLKTNVFKCNEIEASLRFLASGKHIGKVLINVKEEAKDEESLPLNITPQINFNPEKVSILVGGLGGFGLELADWMIKRGAEKLVLNSRRGITNSYQLYKINFWKSYGVQIEVNTFDSTTFDGCKSLIEDASKLGVVEGIWNLAVSLQDRKFSNQTEDMFIKSLQPKAHATNNLSEVSIKLCPELKHFVVFSCVSSGFGNFGQTNYGMANSIMEHLMEKRRSLGLPAKAIQWGPISEVGLIAENNLNVKLAGLDFQPISSCLQVLDKILTSDDTIVLSTVVAEKMNTNLSSTSVKEIILSVLGIKDINSIRPDATLGELGMDSLISVEISQILARDYDVRLSPDAIKFLKFNELEQLVANKGILSVEQDHSKLEFLFAKDFNQKTSNDLIIPVPSSYGNSTSSLKVLIIPSIVGTLTQTWKNISLALKCRSFFLQHEFIQDCTTLDEMVSALAQDVKALYQNDDTFFIVSHSFGSILALKLAEILEAEGKTGKMIFIDGSPWMTTNWINFLLPPNANDEQIQDELTTGYARRLIKNDTLIAEVLRQKTFDSKLATIVELGMKTIEIDSEEVKNYFTSLTKRMKISQVADQISYVKLKATTLIFVKAKEENLKDIPSDYGLQQFFSTELKVHIFDGDHFTIIENPEIIDLVNSEI